MQEQIYTLKGRLAVAEDSLRRRGEGRGGKKSEGDVDLQVRNYEQESNRLKEDRNFWETKANILEQKLAKAQTDPSDLDPVRSSPLLQSREKREKHGKEEELKESKALNQELTTEVEKLREKVGQMEVIQSQQSWLKADLLELETQIDKKDDLLKSANKRFLLSQKRIETLEKDNSALHKSVQLLEIDRKRLSEKWQR